MDLSFKEFSDFIDSIIYKVNGKSIQRFNKDAEAVRRKINEMISKVFGQSLSNGLQHLAQIFQVNGIDVTVGPIPPNDKTNEIINDALPEIFSKNVNNIDFLRDASLFVKYDCGDIEAESFYAPLFYRFSFSIMFLTLAEFTPSGPLYLFKVMFSLIFVGVGISFLYYVPRNLKKRRKIMAQYEEYYKEEFRKIFP